MFYSSNAVVVYSKVWCIHKQRMPPQARCEQFVYNVTSIFQNYIHSTDVCIRLVCKTYLHCDCIKAYFFYTRQTWHRANLYYSGWSQMPYWQRSGRRKQLAARSHAIIIAEYVISLYLSWICRIDVFVPCNIHLCYRIFRGCVPEMFVTSYSVTYCIYIPGKLGFCFRYYCEVYDECK